MDSYFIPSSYSRIVARELALQEKDLPRLLRDTGLPVEILLPGDETRLTGRQQLQLLDNAQGMLDRPELGLRLGQQLQPSAHGPLGYLALSSPDLMTALESLRDFLPARLPMVKLDLQLGGDLLCCSLEIKLEANREQQRIFHECFALVVQSFVEAVLGRPVIEAKIEVAHPRPAYYAAYEDYLHSPVEFSCDGNRYLLPGRLARVPNVSGDPELYSLAQELCLKLLNQVPDVALSTTDRVRHMLLMRTPGSITETDVARAMFISKRTLARRLEQEGSSYRRIRETLLAEMAARHLQESGLSVEAVAAMLGYNDAAAFHKAFRRWYGQSPGQFRRLGQR